MSPRRPRVLCLSAATALTLSLGAVSCGHSDDVDMSGEVTRMMDRTASMDEAVATHASTVSGTTDLAVVGAEESSHADLMTAHMAEIDNMMGRMGSYCMGGTSAREHMRDMRTAMSALMAEHERHRGVARPDAAAAHAEEDRHLREVRAILGNMQAAGDEMRRNAGGYRCRHCC
jgi:hypothetical protein